MNKKYLSGFLIFFSILILGFAGSKLISRGVLPWTKTKDNDAKPPKTINMELYKIIEEYDEENRVEPIDAMIDRVWKAIPGYNGLAVDIDASYERMEAEGIFDESKIIYKEIPPNIHLDDLDPEPIYRGNPQKPMVAFLINVAWGNEFIPPILNTLENHQIKATFFFDGSWVKKNPDLAKMIWKAGHEIGNHAYSHPDLSKYSATQIKEEIEKTNEVIWQTLGVETKWFAPPSGSFNQATIHVAHELNMKTILWTVDTVDWRKPETREMVRRVVGKVESGMMVLMHPTKPTAEGLDAMIKEVKDKGFHLGTVSELMSEQRI